MRGRVLVTLAAAILTFVLVGNAHAQVLNRVSLNGWTQVSPQGTPPAAVNRIAFIIYVTFNPVAHQPDFVKQITITAPDGSVFSIDPGKDWLINDQAFYKNFLATDFKSGIIPGGTYKATVVSTSGSSISDTDSIFPVFLTIPSITYPSSNQTGVPAMPTFRWTAVGSAKYYRVQLWNASTDEPVFYYYSDRNNFQTDLTYAHVPKGVLKPNNNYRLQIQARSNSQDVDYRSQTAWVNFTTGSW